MNCMEYPTDHATYSAPMLAKAALRGYSHAAHVRALESGDEEWIALTHPYNWLTEAEAEAEYAKAMERQHDGA